MKKFINKLKEHLNKNVSFNPWIVGITSIVSITALCVSYNLGSTHKVNQLVEQKAQATIEELKQSDAELASEIEKLSSQKNKLNVTLSNKADIQNAMQEYETNKVEYTNQISQLNTSIASLDTSIQQKQTSLNEKKAAKAEEQRIAAEKAAQEAAKQKAAASQNATVNNNQSYTVYITNTGSKYHSSGCQYLKKSKIPISKDKAVAQGYTACSRCHP